ncbi:MULTISPECIES: restriction endonuclease subunit S [unclassified Vibrio]|uniref:Restriction endonuclease subunit S n=1 Tax=Vibrio sp. HB236076 TaxID=3232307 RepID=A0AB39HI88_9VIBR|nr:restriction endonuclease subunit S [Vibrio sp. HB161653]MDP5252645.1 restriction endonuclease subunit S [Vibrio sp. HB161653]
MSDKDQNELESILEQAGDSDAEVALPSLDQQKQIVAELKKLEQEGKLTPEVLEHYFSQYNPDDTAPIH